MLALRASGLGAGGQGQCFMARWVVSTAGAGGGKGGAGAGEEGVGGGAAAGEGGGGGETRRLEVDMTAMEVAVEDETVSLARVPLSTRSPHGRDFLERRRTMHLRRLTGFALKVLQDLTTRNPPSPPHTIQGYFAYKKTPLP